MEPAQADRTAGPPAPLPPPELDADSRALEFTGNGGAYFRICPGLYRPFARVSEYRLQIESLTTLHARAGPQQSGGATIAQQQPRGAPGDALADAAGLDLIG